MDCGAATTRLVAFQDEELSPGEHALVGEHLARCATCRSLERRLAHASPRPFLQLAPEREQQLFERLDQALDEAWDRPVPPAPAPRFRSLRRPLAIPFGVAMVYSAAFVLAIGWGMWNWVAARELQAELATRPASAPPVTTIPADQFRPASWSPASADHSTPPQDRP